MKVAFVFALAVACACGDPGHRDRSMKRKLEGAPARTRTRAETARPRRPTSSVIGLLSDPLATLYPEGATMVVRFNDATSLMRRVGPHLTEVSRALPRLKLPKGNALTFVRRVLRLPESVVIDPLRPFAFVQTEHGWAGIIPARDLKRAGTRMRQLDGIYSVAGDPQVVSAYTPGFRKGFFLPGDCSVIASPRAAARLGTELTKAFSTLGVNLLFLDNRVPGMPDDIERVDIAIRFAPAGMRCDLRLAPNRDSATAIYLERMQPRASSAVRWLPRDGTLYVELGASIMEWEGLVFNLLRDQVEMRDAVEAPGLHAVRRGLSELGGDAAAMLDLDADGNGHAYVVANLESARAARDYLRSPDFKTLLNTVAGKGGHLEWMENVSARKGVEIGAITGHISRKRLSAWRKKDRLHATLSVLMRGPVLAYTSIVGDKFCLVVGHNARAETDRLIDALLSGRPAGNEHTAEVDTLFKNRLASVSMDLGGLFDGSREAAPYWHRNGRVLRNLALRRRVPVSAAVTVESGALRIASRIPPRMLADAAAKIIAALEK